MADDDLDVAPPRVRRPHDAPPLPPGVTPRRDAGATITPGPGAAEPDEVPTPRRDAPPPRRTASTIAPPSVFRPSDPVSASTRDADVAELPTVDDAQPRPTPPPRRRLAKDGLAPGDHLGRWVLDRTLGSGATADVWSAHHEQLGSPVAIKVFHRRDLPFRTVLGEARAAAGIPSRHVVWVYDVDTFDGYHAIVMELCGGDGAIAQSLKEFTVDGADEAARLVAEAARGVQAAHDADIFHKDIKPANILIDPKDRRAQITDFGLANPALWRRPDHGGDQHTAQSTVWMDPAEARPADLHDTLTPIRGSLRIGTPEFMAPEQAAGLRRDLDPHDAVHRRHLIAMDVYGLGSTLYHVLSGHPPFPYGDALRPDVDVDEILDQVVQGPPPSLRKVAPHVPRRLAAIVDKAMARLPSERHASATELADDLDAWRTQYPTTVDRSLWVRLGVHAHRERARLALLGALALVTLGSSAIVWQNARRIADQAGELEVQEAQLSTLTAAHASAQADLQATAAVLADAQETLQQKDGLLDAQGRRLREREARLEATSAELATTTESLTSVGDQLADAEARIGALEASRVALQTTLEARRAELAETQADLQAARFTLDAEVTKRETLEDEVATLETLSDAQRDEIADQRARLNKLAAEAEKLRASASLLRSRVESDRADMRKLEEENAYLRRVLANIRDASALPPDPAPAPAPSDVAPRFRGIQPADVSLPER